MIPGLSLNGPEEEMKKKKTRLVANISKFENSTGEEWVKVEKKKTQEEKKKSKEKKSEEEERKQEVTEEDWEDEVKNLEIPHFKLTVPQKKTRGQKRADRMGRLDNLNKNQHQGNGYINLVVANPISGIKVDGPQEVPILTEENFPTLGHVPEKKKAEVQKAVKPRKEKILQNSAEVEKLLQEAEDSFFYDPEWRDPNPGPTWSEFFAISSGQDEDKPAKSQESELRAWLTHLEDRIRRKQLKKERQRRQRVALNEGMKTAEEEPVNLLHKKPIRGGWGHVGGLRGGMPTRSSKSETPSNTSLRRAQKSKEELEDEIKDLEAKIMRNTQRQVQAFLKNKLEQVRLELDEKIKEDNTQQTLNPDFSNHAYCIDADEVMSLTDSVQATVGTNESFDESELEEQQNESELTAHLKNLRIKIVRLSKSEIQKYS